MTVRPLVVLCGAVSLVGCSAPTDEFTAAERELIATLSSPPLTGRRCPRS